MVTSRTQARACTRREVLQVSSQAGLGALALMVGGGALLPVRRAVAQRAPDGIREMHLETREVMWELAPGKRIKAMAYNGQVPGPEIRVQEGERVRVILTNALAEPTTIHWHGLEVPNPMDGVPGLTQPPVRPGETFVYEFAARPAGTRWYHTHFQGHRQLDLGLAAPLIIEPAQPEPFPFDREYTLVLDDWATGLGRPLPSTREGTAGARGGMGGMMAGMMGRGMGQMMCGDMGGMMGGAHTPVYDTMTINGKAYPATVPLTVRQGERVRLRLINASAEHTHVIRLAGHQVQVTHTDGNPLVRPVEVDAVPIAPSERYDVLFVADRPGAWFLACAEPGHADAGERVLLVYEGHEGEGRPLNWAPSAHAVAGEKPLAPREEAADLRLWHYRLGHSRETRPPLAGQEKTFPLTLSGGMMGSDAWTINGKQYPHTDPMHLRQGERVRVQLRNHSMEAHPMHLHGQSFQVLVINGQPLAQPLMKDSVDVEAHLGAVEIAFTAVNPGNWLFHCHKPMHMEGGMVTLVTIA